MALDFILKPDVRLSAAKLNDVNDAIAGGNVAGGTGQQLYAGTVGARLLLDNATALTLSDTATGTLLGGIYQYVQFLSGATQAPTIGRVAFWATTQTGANLFATDNQTPYLVTTDGSASVGDGLWAGIILNSVTKGNFGWIQVAGLANCAYKATPTDNTIGDLVVVVTTTFTVDTVADGTAVTASILKRQIGVAAEAPGASGSIALHRVLMKNNCWLF